MNIVILILKTACLFVGVFFFNVNTRKQIAKNPIPTPNVLYEAIGIAGFITLQWLI